MKTTSTLISLLALAASGLAAPAATSTSKCKSSGKSSSGAKGKAAATSAAPSLSTGSAIASGNSTSSSSSSNDLGIPSGCLTKNSIAIGWLPDEDNGGTMPPITSALGAKTCFYGLYSQITSTTYDASQLTSRISDIKNSGGVLQAAVMPTKVKFNQVNSDLAGQVCKAMKTFTDEGITVWLRFAHEFNYYVTDGTYEGGSQQEFVTMWQTLASACKSNDKIKMYWSPNNIGNNADSLDGWWPGADNVDIVGIDVYPKEGTNFAAAYGSFYNAFAKKYNKPFYIGETGSTGSDSAKKEWLTDLVNPGSEFPLYGGMSWFEYNKKGEGDFRVVLGDQDIAKSVLE